MADLATSTVNANATAAPSTGPLNEPAPPGSSLGETEQYCGGRHTTKCEERQQYVRVQLSGMTGEGQAAEGAATLDLQGSGQAASSGEPVFSAVTIWVYSDSDEDGDTAPDATAGDEPAASAEPVPMDMSSEPEPMAHSSGNGEAASSSSVPIDSGGNSGNNAGLQTFYLAQGAAIPAVFDVDEVDLDAMD